MFDFSKLIREIRVMAGKIIHLEVHSYLAGVCDYGLRLFHRSDTLVVEMNRVLCVVIIALLVACGALSLGLNHYRDNAITYKAQRDKMSEN
ncbi:murein endopeptidase; DLP12 prophage [Escherichia coli]|uniref:Murein endopeptidase DLP12 prophage n=1 Tax=Escherichia coli TaxID=562 RepID=A0A376ZF13_ECOLX|nr:murein endopeptidase; DLP12 prophage [Escherichia coli]